MEYAVLYNPHSGGGKGLQIAKEIEKLMGEHSYNYHDLTEIESLDYFVSSLPQNTDIILTGGDGSLNHFIKFIINLYAIF